MTIPIKPKLNISVDKRTYYQSNGAFDIQYYKEYLLHLFFKKFNAYVISSNDYRVATPYELYHIYRNYHANFEILTYL